MLKELNRKLDEDLEFEVNIRNDLHHFREAQWPSYIEGSLLENAVIEASENLQVSKEMAFTSALGVMATACQGLIQVQQPTGNRVNTNLMLLTIAESGERKTTVEKQFFKSIRQLQANSLEHAEKSVIEFERDHQIWKLELNALTSLLKKEKQKSALNPKDDQSNTVLENLKDELKSHQQKEPIPALGKRFIYDDTTPQALVRMMNENYKHACLLSSEANGIFNGRAFEELHLLNSLWDGVDITVDRTSKPSFVLSNARLTLALMTQMQVINKFLNKRGEEARGLGFLARFLVVRPKHLAGQRKVTTELSELACIQKFNQRVEEILLKDVKQQEKNTPEERSAKQVLRFSQTAAKAWKSYAQGIEDAQKEGEVYEFYKDHASKLMDNITRVAGVIHYFQNPEQHTAEIKKDTLDFAYHVCMRYSKHFLMHIADEPSLIKQTKALITYLYQPPAPNKPDNWDENASDRYSDNKQWQPRPCNMIEGEYYRAGRVIKFTAREIRQYGPSMIRPPEKLYRVVRLLEDLGFVKQQKTGRSTHWELHEALVYNDLGQMFTNKAQVTPRFKNGEEYSISNLPLFEDIVPIEYSIYARETTAKINNDDKNRMNVHLQGKQAEPLKHFIRCSDVEATEIQ